MSEKPSEAAATAFAELLEAFEFSESGGVEARAYVHLDTGKIYFVSGQEDLDEETPEDIDESDRYVMLPDKRELDLGNRLVFAFAEQEMADDYDTVRGFFRREGAYSRFKDLLDAKGMIQQWYDFEAKATESAFRAWCQENGIVLRET